MGRLTSFLLVSLVSFCTTSIVNSASSISDIQNFQAKQNLVCNNYFKKILVDAAECKRQCDSNEKCFSFSYEDTTRVCTIQGGEGSFASKTGVTTYFKDSRCASALEGGVVSLKCSQGTIISEVLFASYGTPTGTCGNFAVGSCDQAHARDVIQDLCIGENSCQISASSHLFGEPCPVITKNLRVEVKCEVSSLFNEDHYFNEWSSRHWPSAQLEIQARKSKITSLLAALPPYPTDTFAGRGIIIVAGGKYLESAFVQVKMLRKYQCRLRIQVWHLGEEEMTPAQIKAFAEYNVESRDFKTYVSPTLLAPIQANVGLRLFQLKPLAILHSDLSEVLLLDSDNVPLRDPAFLFDTPEFQAAGSIFWPDYWTTSLVNPIWQATGQEPARMWEQESGQLLINKAVAWRALNLCVHLNDAFYMRLLNGDKDTFRFAWLAAGVQFHMIDHWPIAVGTMKETHSADQGFCGHSMMQRDAAGTPLFLHHNQLKNFHLPRGTNFQQMKLPTPGTQFRAVPVKGLQSADIPVISCTDIQGPGLMHVDADAFPAVDAQLQTFESEYFAAKDSIPKDLFPQPEMFRTEDRLPTQTDILGSALRDKLRQVDSNTTCTALQFELEAPTLHNDRLCETITVCDPATQVAGIAATSSSDRVCMNKAADPGPRLFSVRVRDQKSSLHPYFNLGDTPAGYEVQDVTHGGAYVEGGTLTLTRYESYVFAMDKVPATFPLILTLDNVGGPKSSVYLDGVTGNDASGKGTLFFVPSANAPSMLYYQSHTFSHMGWRVVIKDPSYAVTFQGNHAGNDGAKQRFSTGFSTAAHLFTVSDVSGVGKFKSVRDSCQSLCSSRPSCLGLFVYRLSDTIFCNGLADVSGPAMPTLSDSQSVLKVLS